MKLPRIHNDVRSAATVYRTVQHVCRVFPESITGQVDWVQSVIASFREITVAESVPFVGWTGKDQPTDPDDHSHYVTES